MRHVWTGRHLRVMRHNAVFVIHILTVLSLCLVQLIIGGGRLGSGKAAQLVVYLNLNLRWADFSSVCYIWRVCMSACLPNMPGLDGLASVQLSHAKSERLSEALIRGKDGQSCRFPFSHLMWSRPVGECQDSLAVFPKLPARLEASRGNRFWKA